MVIITAIWIQIRKHINMNTLRRLPYVFKNSAVVSTYCLFLVLMMLQSFEIPYKIEFNNTLVDAFYTITIFLNIIVLFIITIIFFYLLSLVSINQELPNRWKPFVFIILLMGTCNFVYYMLLENNKANFSVMLYIKCLLNFIYFSYIIRLSNHSYSLLKSKQFEVIKQNTGLLPIIYTPNFTTNHQKNNYYILSFNRSIKSWHTLGFLMLSNEDGLFIKRKHTTYKLINNFNSQLSKNLNEYTNDELLLLKMCNF